MAVGSWQEAGLGLDRRMYAACSMDAENEDVSFGQQVGCYSWDGSQDTFQPRLRSVGVSKFNQC